MSKKIVVVGAGLAGLSAAKNLVDNGFEITLLESRSVFGGKVSSWKDSDGDWIESGLHVFFGSYQKIFDLMKDVGCYQNIDWQTPSIQYKIPGGNGFQIVSNEHLPPPLNLLPNFFFNHQFSISDLLKYCRAILPVLLKNQNYINAQDDKDFISWVKQFGVSDEMVKRMFLPMTLSLKFLPASQISAQVVLNVFKLFITNPKGFKIGFLNGAPAEKLTGPIVQYLEKRGAKILLNQKVLNLEITEINGSKSIRSLQTQSGDNFDADYFVFALPTHKFKKILTPYFEDIDYFKNLSNFKGVPVANAQFWVDKPITNDKRLHFGTGSITPVFADMNLACGDYKTPKGSSLIETVIAPAENFSGLSDEEILEKAWNEIKSYFPNDSMNAKVVKSSLVKIPQSVYAPHPNLEKLRPSQNTPIPNLFIAGGFTKGHEFFDSMEGAVQSGLLAAEKLIEKQAFNN
ncbi:MAG: FAD-dependent oxidoreductase [Candidatus Caenarcaniphilales bacterium]|nr:FAD-dependent oxidoreductase [Candidatus Caenarcaniphilales bacterium]